MNRKKTKIKKDFFKTIRGKQSDVKNAGITLISLIITIIILLILTGVVVNFSLGENGIIGKAQNAVDKYKNAQEKEEMEIAKIENEIDNYVSGNRGNVTLTEEEYAQFKSIFSINSDNNPKVAKDRPDTWIPGVEYCWKSGNSLIYGKRFVGDFTTFTNSDNLNVAQLKDESFVGYSLLNFGGYWHDNGNYKMSVSFYVSDNSKSYIYIHPTSGLVFNTYSRNSRTNQPYDIWVIYTKY